MKTIVSTISVFIHIKRTSVHNINMKNVGILMSSAYYTLRQANKMFEYNKHEDTNETKQPLDIKTWKTPYHICKIN